MTSRTPGTPGYGFHGARRRTDPSLFCAPPCLSERTAEPGGEPPARASQPRARRGKASLLLLPVDFLMHGRSRLDLLAGKKLRREK